MEQGYLGGQIPTPFELGDMNSRIESIQRDANHDVVLQRLVVDRNERITNGQKLFAERLFELWKDYRPVEQEFPKDTPSII